MCRLCFSYVFLWNAAKLFNVRTLVWPEQVLLDWDSGERERHWTDAVLTNCSPVQFPVSRFAENFPSTNSPGELPSETRASGRLPASENGNYRPETGTGRPPITMLPTGPEPFLWGSYLLTLAACGEAKSKSQQTQGCCSSRVLHDSEDVSGFV